MIEYLEPQLTEEELAVYKRGRNAKSPTMAKNATMADYRRRPDWRPHGVSVPDGSL